jgi:hypothetical protein
MSLIMDMEVGPEGFATANNADKGKGGSGTLGIARKVDLGDGSLIGAE